MKKFLFLALLVTLLFIGSPDPACAHYVDQGGTTYWSWEAPSATSPEHMDDVYENFGAAGVVNLFAEEVGGQPIGYPDLENDVYEVEPECTISGYQVIVDDVNVYEAGRVTGPYSRSIPRGCGSIIVYYDCPPLH